MTRSRPIIPPSVKPGIPRVERFPPSWRRVPFGDLLEPSFRPVKLESDKTYQLVVAKRNRGGIAPRERLRGEQIKTPTQFALRTGDFVIAKRQIIHGGCGFVPEELDGAIVSGEYDVFRPRAALAAAFLRWFTHTTYFQQTCYQSSIGVDVEKMIFQTDRWMRVPMPLPPTAQQARIASILDAAEAAENACDSAIAAKRRLKRALLQQLLTGKRRFTSFGGDWRVAALTDIVRVRSGNTPSKSRADFWGGSVPWVSAKDLKSTRLNTSIDWITDLAVGNGAAMVQPGAVVILVRGMTLLKDVPVALVARRLAINQDIKALEPTTEVDSEFLLYALSARRSQLLGFVNRAGHGTGKLDTDRLLSLPIRFPAIAEQRRVAGTLAALDYEMTLLGRQLAALRRLKRGLMQKLLTGELEIPAHRTRTTEEVPA